MKRGFTVVIEKDEDGYYIGSVPELKGCHSQARSQDELIERHRKAILVCLEVQEEVEVPTELIGIHKVAL